MSEVLTPLTPTPWADAHTASLGRIAPNLGRPVLLTDADIVALYNAVIGATLTLCEAEAASKVVEQHNRLLYKLAKVLP